MIQEITKAIQSRVNVESDGVIGMVTLRAIYKAMSGEEWEPPAVNTAGIGEFPQSAIDLILDEEGLDQPGKWPGGGSGITLGFGCDIGADPSSLEFWSGILSEEQITRLATAKGITGRSAAHIASRFRDIKVSRTDAMRVFIQNSLPTEIDKTRKAYPGIDSLPAVVLGVMTSITYNRGTSMDGDRRRELRIIAKIIGDFTRAPKETRDVNKALREIADQIMHMKRLWVGKGLDGLLTRRENEAEMILSAQSV